MECKGGRSNTWDGGFQGEEQNWDSVARIKTLSLVTSYAAQKPHHFLPRDCQETAENTTNSLNLGKETSSHKHSGTLAQSLKSGLGSECRLRKSKGSSYFSGVS